MRSSSLPFVVAFASAFTWGLVSGCSTASDDPRSPVPGDDCTGPTTVCEGSGEHVLYCDGGALEIGLACPVDQDEGGGRACLAEATFEGADPGVPACSFEFGRPVYFGLPGGTCDADDRFRACTTDTTRFLTCRAGVLVDPCPADFALPVDCSEADRGDPPSEASLECVAAGQSCDGEGLYQCIGGVGTVRCEGGRLVESDVCDAFGGGCTLEDVRTHVRCGDKRRAEAGKPCAPEEEPTCSGDDADLLECVGGTWAATPCPVRCAWPVEFDPPYCE